MYSIVWSLLCTTHAFFFFAVRCASGLSNLHYIVPSAEQTVPELCLKWSHSRFITHISSELRALAPESDSDSSSRAVIACRGSEPFKHFTKHLKSCFMCAADLLPVTSSETRASLSALSSLTRAANSRACVAESWLCSSARSSCCLSAE